MSNPNRTPTALILLLLCLALAGCDSDSDRINAEAARTQAAAQERQAAADETRAQAALIAEQARAEVSTASVRQADRLTAEIIAQSESTRALVIVLAVGMIGAMSIAGLLIGLVLARRREQPPQAIYYLPPQQAPYIELPPPSYSTPTAQWPELRARSRAIAELPSGRTP